MRLLPFTALLVILAPAAMPQDQGQAQPPPAQSSSIVDTKHNLSVSGPGPFKASTESQICIFCHAPHRARSTAPLWNREDSRQTYLTYTSSTFGGTMTQPSGGSKLCLSCHDGSIALGAVVSLSADIEMQSGFTMLDTGPGFLGSNLMDDHPISFDYSDSKGGMGLDYLPESAITPPVHVDSAGMVQCTSCHDAHSNLHGQFLITSNSHSALCLSCHSPTDWMSSSHSLSQAGWDGTLPDPWPNSDFDTVAENACGNCHKPHGAAKPERLLLDAADEDTCLACHQGTVASSNIGQDLYKAYTHSPFATLSTHDPAEDPLSMPRHAECQDCHDPHAVRSGSVPAPLVPGPLTNISGINGSGQPIDAISFGYELCYKCHSDNNAGNPLLPRQILQTNVRLEFDVSNPSFHPIEGPGANPDVPSLLQGWTEASVISCIDCHASDNSPTFGGNGSEGPHGSIYQPLLGANYDTTDGTPESSFAYALCYKCHSRSSILGDDSFKEHSMHIEDEDVACSACHDPHGVSSSQGNSINNTHLINFDLSVVQPSDGLGIIEFVDEGYQRGNCTLKCHGEDHDQEDY